MVLSLYLVSSGFGIPGIDLRRAAGGENVNDRLGLAGKCGFLGASGPVAAAPAAVCAPRPIHGCNAENRSQAHGAKAHARADEEFAARGKQYYRGDSECSRRNFSVKVWLNCGVMACGSWYMAVVFGERIG